MTKREIIDSMIVKANTSDEEEFRNEIIEWLEFQTDIDKWGRLIFKPCNPADDEPPFVEDSLQLTLYPAVTVDDIRKTYGK
jgi:hypothetical protein